jgi:hypothetical protein
MAKASMWLVRNKDPDGEYGLFYGTQAPVIVNERWTDYYRDEAELRWVDLNCRRVVPFCAVNFHKFADRKLRKGEIIPILGFHVLLPKPERKTAAKKKPAKALK